MTNTLGTWLDSYEETRIEWRSLGRVARGKITIIDGDPGLGKSSLMASWIAAHTSGKALPGGTPPAESERAVILLSAEDDPSDTILPRIRVAGGNPGKVLILNEIAVVNDEGEASLDDFGNPAKRWIGFPDDAPLLEQAIISAGAGLVIIDPLMAFLSRGVSSSSDQDIRDALNPVMTVAQRTGASVIMLRHLNKSGGVKAIYRGGGSIGIIGLSRIGLLFGRAKDDPELRVLAPVKNNIAVAAPSLGYRLISVMGTDVARMECVGEVPYTADDLLLGDAMSEVESDERTESMAWLDQYLRESPRQSNDVIREGRRLGFSERSLKEAKSKLKVRSKKSGFEGGWLWELPHLYLVNKLEDEEAI